MVLMNDFKAEPQALRSAMLDAAGRVIDSGWYVLGKELECFELTWANACGAAYAIGVGNGMDAIEIALRALNIGPGDEVITTPMTAFATVLAILRAGATPVLADIDPDTALLSVASAERCLSAKTKAVLLVHLYGQVRQMNAWQEFCDSHSIHLVEDCAQSHLASWQGKVAGTFGRAGSYSFYPTKNLGALGDGGALITDDQELSDKAVRIRNYGQSVRYRHPDIGMNSRLDEMQAAILSVRLNWLQGFTERRQKIAEMYSNHIKNPHIRLLASAEEISAHVYHLFVVMCEKRNKLMNHLASDGVQSLIHYPVPVHKQPPCGDMKRDPLGLSVSERHADACLSIPCHPQMSDNDVQRVVESLNSYKDH
jgi:dTDP-4-amino-4,6-dideoxygalactose transaminase